ncbi:hypothetical protein, partial [Lactiplantibacillus plantarum]|uniref:hypothetical protein n=1 Tax=Lactiplantibacillus plantarum TaxID=1590 RepID=UPI00070EF18D
NHRFEYHCIEVTVTFTMFLLTELILISIKRLFLINKSIQDALNHQPQQISGYQAGIDILPSLD